MSGIYGFSFSEHSVDTKRYKNILKAWNNPYGEDGNEVFINEALHLGICHEWFSKLSNASFRTYNEDYCAVIDVVIYNRDELIELFNVSDVMSDEEIVFSILVSKGLESLQYVNGDFAGVLFNRSNNELTLFRDHMGVRPLFVYKKDRDVAFSTDIRGLVALEACDCSPSDAWLLNTYCGKAISKPESTAYQYIEMVNIAGYLTINLTSGEVISKGTYWQPANNKIWFINSKKYQHKMRELIEDSINRRVEVCKGKIGAELSGGLDSSVIAILLSRVVKDVTYVSWAISPDKYPLQQNDERAVINDICNQERIRCDYIDDNLKEDQYDTIISTMKDNGIGAGKDFTDPLNPYFFNTDLLSGTAQFMKKQGVCACFTGHGGDEGVSHRCADFEMYYHGEYIHYLKQCWLRTENRKHRLVETARYIRKDLKIAKRHMAETCLNSDTVALLNDSCKTNYSKIPNYVIKFAYDPKQHVLDGNDTNRLLNVAYQGAYNGIRYLVPYLDYRVIDYALSIPRYLYQHGKIDRYIYREVFRNIIPESLYLFNCKECLAISNEDRRKLKEKECGKSDAVIEELELDTYISEIKEMIADIDMDMWGEYLNKEVIDAWLGEFSFDVSSWERNINFEKALTQTARFSLFIKSARQYSVNL